jgi:secreted PhoX family phosphatase
VSGALDRRALLRAAAVGTGAVAFGGSLWRAAAGAPAVPGPTRYGPLRAADAHGLELPAGFTSRVVARSGQRVGSTSYVWHPAPDGGACFPSGSGWIYVSNSEVVSGGGASAVRFDAAGTVVAAYRVLSGTRVNCAGGATPWGRWLSCEEVDRGCVWDTDPTGATAPVRRDAMGRFQHEAAAVDPDRRVVYLTEDEPDGCFYRYRPDRWPDLTTGVLEVLRSASATGPVTWARVPDPSAARARTRYQVAGARRFAGGEGCWYADGSCWFTTKGDGRVWRYDAGAQQLSLAYDDAVPGAPLTGVDNVVGSEAGELFVAEDGGDMQICVITAGGHVAPFLRVVGHPRSEVTGPAFSPDGRRLYFSSQRGSAGTSGGGVTYEVRGPFRRSRPEIAPGRRRR